MVNEKSYPSLSTLVNVEDIPILNLGFIEEGINQVFGEIYYKDLLIQRSPDGASASYAITLLSYRKLGIEIPGTQGMALVLNPDSEDNLVSAFPVSLSYNIEGLKLIRGFDLENFSENPLAFFNTLIDALGINKEKLLLEVIEIFLGSFSLPFDEFISRFNSYNDETIELLNDPDPSTIIRDLIDQIEELDYDVFEIIYENYIAEGTVSFNAIISNLRLLFSRVAGEIQFNDILQMFIPRIAFSLNNLDLALEFPRTILLPVDANNEVIDEDPNIPEPLKQKSRLTFNVGSLSYSTETGLKFIGENSFDFDRSMIGNTGFILFFSGMKLDLSRETNIPEATADGRPVDFMGVFVETAEIGLPSKWFKDDPANPNPGASIVGQNLIIGTGGISGKIALVTTGDPFHQKLGKFEVSLNMVAVELHQNSFVSSDIKGKLKINGFKDAGGVNDAVIDIGVHIGNDGDFNVIAVSTAGIPLKIPGVLDFNVKSLGFGKDDDRFYLSTSGTITCTFNIPALTLDRPIAFEMKELIIWDDGQIELRGGNIILPQALTLKIGPVKLSITAISFGSYERNGRKYKYFGFDGGVNVNPGGVDVRASGVKVYFTVDSGPFDLFVRIEGIAIDLIIPGSKSADEATVLISGFLQVKEPDTTVPGSNAGTEYGGGVSFKLPKAGIGGSAAMRLIPSLPAFIVDTELSISVPIPLGNTSLGIYGFRGLIGFRYVADRAYPPLGLAPDASWYEYYKKKVQLTYKEGINIDKFAQRKGFAIGAGVTIGTLTDSGKAFSAKLFLLLSLPDALLLQGQAAIMAERVDLSPNDPPFSVLIALTKQSVEAAFGVAYKLPSETGAILDLNALIEMGFYFQDSSAWYINIGRDLPESKRVTARIVTLFDAWSYLMLSASGIKAGAGASWEFNKGFGPVKIELRAYLDAQGRISFKPKQIGGAVHIGGSVAVKVFKFKLGLSAAASLAAESPHPFIVTGSVEVCIDLPKPFKKFGGCFTLDFTWTFDPNVPKDPNPIFNEAGISEAGKSVNVVTRERFELNVPSTSLALTNPTPPPPSSGWAHPFDDHVMPLDSSIDIEFKKPIAPGAATTNIGITGMGYNNIDVIPPQKGKSAKVYHAYTVDEVKIRSWNPATSQWQDYDVYAALTPLAHASFIDPSDLIGLKQGWWQVDQPGKVNKLSLLSQSPLSYANDTTGNFVPENSGVTSETIYCPEEPIEMQCIKVDMFPDLTVFPAGVRRTVNNLQIRVVGEDGQVAQIINPFGLQRGLVLQPLSQLEIFFPELTGRVSVRLITLADDVTVSYQRRTQIGVDSSNQPVFTYQTIRQDVLIPISTLKVIEYDFIDEPIDRLVIIAGKCKCMEGQDAVVAVSAAANTIPVIRPRTETAPVIRDPKATGETPRTGCGSIAAWLLQVCFSAQQQLNQLQQEYNELLAQAQLLQELCKKYQDDPCSSNLAEIYCNQAQQLLEQAAALAAQIKNLQAFIRCCEAFTHATGLSAENMAREITKLTESRAVQALNCGTDPKFDFTCTTVVFQVCWMPLSAQIYNSTLPDYTTVLNNNNAMVTAISNAIYPIWRPDTDFAVTLKVSDRVTAPEQGYDVTTTRYMHVGFRTKGPVGHFHEERAEYDALKAADRGDQFRLQSLKPYIDFSKSYPNADGNILNAKPLFYVNPKLQLFYNQPYIYTMYGGTFDPYNGKPAISSSLETSILDPVNPLPADANDPAYVGPVLTSFAVNNFGIVPQDVEFLGNMAEQGEPCNNSGTAIETPGIQTNVTVDKLKPLKLYLAVFKANYNSNLAEVHRYNFQTSRYADFPEQVNSYKLKDRNGVYVKDAVYDDITVTLDTTRTAQLTALLSNSYPAGDPLEQEYADPFDRLQDGILQTGPIDPPVGTDFNIVRDSLGNVLGILLRNPEPFNDPKIPPAVISTTITLSQGGGPVNAYTVIHSKDRSKAFIGNATLNMPLADLQFTFRYLEYNGAIYNTASTVTVNLFVTPPPFSSSSSSSL